MPNHTYGEVQSCPPGSKIQFPMNKQKANSPHGYLQVLFYGIVNMVAATVKGCESTRLYSDGWRNGIEISESSADLWMCIIWSVRWESPVCSSKYPLSPLYSVNSINCCYCWNHFQVSAIEEDLSLANFIAEAPVKPGAAGTFHELMFSCGPFLSCLLLRSVTCSGTYAQYSLNCV